MPKKKEFLIILTLAVLMTLGFSSANFGIGNTVFQPEYPTRGLGFPLSWSYPGMCLGFACNFDFHAFPFLLNLLFWLLILAGGWWVYKKFKKKELSHEKTKS